MSFTLFPESPLFYELFDKQCSRLVQAAQALERLLADLASAPENCRTINDLEVEGNRGSREISRELAASFITPIDREDIHDINTELKLALGLVKAVSVRIGLYRFPTIPPTARNLAGATLSMATQTREMLVRLRHKQPVDELRDKIRKEKEDADAFLLVGLGELYERDARDSEHLRAVIMLSQVYDRLEAVVDRLECLAGIIEGVSLKFA